MAHLSALNKYFLKYKVRLLAGIFFVIASNWFAVLAPEVTGYIIAEVQSHLPGTHRNASNNTYGSVVQAFISWVHDFSFDRLVLVCSVTILLLALMRGLLMFFMRQTIIVMSRHIEYDLKNEIYAHYQKLDMGFFKVNRTGDLMNRIAEDVSRVRAYTGPALMYFINLVALISFCIVNMLRKDTHLTLVVLSPLPFLAVTIYFVNTIIHKKSERVQTLLSQLTTNAQEAYSGIRVIKSFVQEKAMLGFFKINSEAYRKNSVSLAGVEAIYFPSMTLMVGLSTLLTILIGGRLALHDSNYVGTIVEFVIYINMLSFPVAAIGSVASMVQRASASQKRINEFLDTRPEIYDTGNAENAPAVKLSGDIIFEDVSFTYPHTGIQAINQFSLTIKEKDKVLVLGKTGSGKSTLAQLLLRFYDPGKGIIRIGNTNINEVPIRQLRSYFSYVPQDVFLFSDTIANNISFGLSKGTDISEIYKAAGIASIDEEIRSLEHGYDTLVGERGVTLSGGQKQRASIARALLKAGNIMLFDDCLSAVDAKTESKIAHNLNEFLSSRTAIIITHRILPHFHFNNIIVMEDGAIIEQGTHDSLISGNGYYAELYHHQVSGEKESGK